MPDISIESVMTTSVHTVAPDLAIEDAVRTMRQKAYSCLVVLEAGASGAKPIGIVTERDILKLANLLLDDLDHEGLTAQSVMTSPTIHIQRSANILEAILLCQQTKIRHLPVVDEEGNLCGLLTQSDLLSAHIHSLELMNQKLEENKKSA